MSWLDKATPEIILEGVRDILGVDAVGGDCKMNWELQRIIATWFASDDAELAPSPEAFASALLMAAATR